MIVKKNELLPSSWEIVQLGVVCELNPKLDKTEYNEELDVSFVPMPAVQAENGKIDVSEVKKFVSVKKGYTSFKEADVLFAKITPCMENGKMAVVPKVLNGLGFGSTEFHVIRPHNGISPKFIYYYISSKLFRIEAEHNMTGAVGQKRVPGPWLSRAALPIPPSSEQHRIVAKIEELFSELDKGIESLKAAREQLKVYRQSLLKHAFEGKLTEQWRKDNADKLETAHELLARIQREREARYQQQLDDWKKAVKEWEGNEKKKEKMPGKPAPLSPFRNLPASQLADLPIGWVRTRFSNLLEYVTSGSRGWANYYSISGAIFVRAQNLKYDNLNLDDIAYVDLPISAEGKRTLIEMFDILVTITGANVTKSAIVEIDLGEAYVSQHVALCRLINSSRAKYLIKFIVAGSLGRRQLEKCAYGAGKPGLNLDNIKELVVPICTDEELEHVTNIIDAKESLIADAEKIIDAQLKSVEALRQSILKKAFSGQLVPQDPNDEPASELLKRIAEEKAKMEAAAKAAKSATRTPKKQGV